MYNRCTTMTKENGYRVKLSDGIVERLKRYAESSGYHSWDVGTIGHSGQGLTVEDVISNLLTKAGF